MQVLVLWLGIFQCEYTPGLGPTLSGWSRWNCIACCVLVFDA